jgi:hypothetical protein
VIRYELVNFLPRFDEWVDLESPADEIRAAVLSWMFTRAENPYLGVKRTEGFVNLWYGAVPHTEHGAGDVVVCSYFINESERAVKCNGFATLSTPI